MVESDILRKCVQEEIAVLGDEELEKVLGYVRSLSKERERRDVPDRLVAVAVKYALGEIGSGRSFRSTEEVFDKLDKELGWR